MFHFTCAVAFLYLNSVFYSFFDLRKSIVRQQIICKTVFLLFNLLYLNLENFNFEKIFTLIFAYFLLVFLLQ